MLSALNALSWWEQAFISLSILGIAILPLYFNMRTVRVIRCDQCRRELHEYRARLLGRKLKRISVDVDVVGKHKPIWKNFEAWEIVSSYLCPRGHLTEVVSLEEINRPKEALWSKTDFRKEYRESVAAD